MSQPREQVKSNLLVCMYSTPVMDRPFPLYFLSQLRPHPFNIRLILACVLSPFVRKNGRFAARFSARVNCFFSRQDCQRARDGVQRIHQASNPFLSRQRLLRTYDHEVARRQKDCCQQTSCGQLSCTCGEDGEHR